MDNKSTIENDINRYKALSEAESEQIIESGLALLPKLSGNSYLDERAFIYSRIGGAQIIQGEYESAFRSISRAREYHERLGNKEAVLKDQLGLGIIYGLSEQPETAFETFLTIRDKARNLELLEVEEAATCNIGRVCNDMGRLEEGLGFLKTARKLVEETGNNSHKAAVLHEIGRIELNRGNLEEASPYLEEAQQLSSEDPDTFSYEVLISLGELYSRTDRIEEAFTHLDKSLTLCRKNNRSHGEIQTLYHLGNLFEETGDSGKAAGFWEECYKLSGSLSLRQFRILSGERLTVHYRKIKDFRKALETLEAVREAEHEDQNERLHHTISIHDQSMRIEDLDQEMKAWRRRSGELERIRSDREESIRELETIKGIGEELTASLDPDRIIQVLHNRLTQLMTMDSLIIAFYLDEENELDVRYIIKDGRHLDPIRLSINPEESLTSWVVVYDQDLLLKTRKESLGYSRAIHDSTEADFSYESHLYVRLKIEGRIIGVLTVKAYEKASYKERHLKVLQALAGFIAIALSNSNAHQSLVMANEQIAYMATHDPLTSLPNRMKIMDRLNQELNRSRRYRKALAILFIDLDGFKDINDTYGHQAGDSVLKTIAERLSSGIRATDAVGRLAGDEFLVILTDNCTREIGIQLAENLRNLLSEKIVFRDEKMKVTASVGLAFYPADGETPETLVNAADQAMYQAKSEGKNRISTLF